MLTKILSSTSAIWCRLGNWFGICIFNTIITHLAETWGFCQLRVVTIALSGITMLIATMIAGGRIESPKWRPFIVITATVRPTTLFVANIRLISRLLWAEKSNPISIFFWVKAVLLLSKQIAHSVPLACVHRQRVSWIWPLHELLCTLRLRQRR